MKTVLIKWHKHSAYGYRKGRKAKIHNAQRTIRQQTKLQLKVYTGKIDTNWYFVFPVEWYYLHSEFEPREEKDVAYYDDFIQPKVSIPIFFD